MKNLLLLFFLAVVSCKTAAVDDIGTQATVYGVVAKDEGDVWYHIKYDEQTFYIEDPKTEKFMGRYVKAEGKLMPRTSHRPSRLLNPKITIVSDYDNIAKIINTPEFDKCFAICRKPEDKFVIYISDYGDLNPDELCGSLTTACSKPVTFAKVDFDVYAHEPSGKVINPRIVVWKENNQYHFYQTESNMKLIASVKRSKVKDISTGVF
jgi:hypothetical protein